MDLLDHQLGQVGERVGEVVGLAQHVRGHVVEDRLLAEVEAHHLGHVGVDRLVVGHAGADRIGQRHAAGAVGRHQAGHAEHRVGAEDFGVEEVVVQPPVDHVHPLRPLGGAHVNRFVLDEQVLTFDQLDAHLLGEEAVLEIRAVEGARGQQHRGRIAHAGGCHRAQGLEQQVGVVLDRVHVVAREQVGEEPHHHLAVLEQVAHPRGHAQVVLEHVVLALAVGACGAHQVDAGDHRVQAAGHVHAFHFGAELGVVEHLLGGDAAGAQDLLAVVDIGEKGVEGAHALAQTDLERRPFGAGNDARQQIEWDQALLAAFLTIDIEGDADAMEGDVGLLALARDALARHLFEPVGVGPVVRAHRAVGGVHFVVGLRSGHVVVCTHGLTPVPHSPAESMPSSKGP